MSFERQEPAPEDVERALRESLRQLRLKHEALEARQRKLTDFLDNSAVSLRSIGPDGRLLWANRAELELLGYSEDEYVGRPLADFCVDPSAAEDMLSRLANEGALRDYEARLRAKDGTVKHVSICSSVYRENGRFVHTRCFSRDITDRRRAEDTLRENERRIETITDALPVLVSYVDREHRYRFVNQAYERWFGRQRADIVGRHIRDVIGEETYAAVAGYMHAALSGESVSYEARAPYAHGGERFIAGTYVPHRGLDGRIEGFVALVADISERKRLEIVRDASVARTERLTAITAAIADAVTREQVFEAIVDQVANAVGASSAALWLTDRDQRTAVLVRALGYSDAAERAVTSLALDREPSLPAVDAIRHAAALWISSQEELTTRYPHLAGIVTKGRSYQISCLPIIAHGTVLGSLGLTFDDDDDDAALHREERQGFLLLVASYSAQALERLRLLEAETASRERAERAAARMAVLGRASDAFSRAGPDLNDVLQTVADEVTRTYADACAILLAADARGALTVAAVQYRNPDARQLAGALVAIDPRTLGQGIFEQSVIAVPLRGREHIVGVLTASRLPSSTAFSEPDRALLVELAERAAMAIENGRLYRDNQQRRERAELLYGVVRALIAADRVEQVFEAALDAIEQALGTNRASILAFDADGVMRFRAWRGLSDAYRRAVEGHSPWSRATKDPAPLVVNDVATEPSLARYGELFRAEGIGALGFIPLAVGGQLLGKFMVYYSEPRDFVAEELDIARAIADHVAAAFVRFAALAELQQAVRFNELFTAILGHDLRNPLGAIISAAQLAIARVETDKLVKPLSRILSSSERMARMIEQLLDFTRVRMGSGIPLTPAEVDLVPVVRQVIDELDDANPEWTIRLTHAGNTAGTWDADRLSQVFSNLVANAVQHGIAEHGVRVHVEGTSSGAVSVEVHNRGVIAAQRIAKLFEPLAGREHRLETSRGLGLGLYISREIVKAHGGEIAVRSSDESGTTFIVSLPRVARTDGESAA